MEWLGNLNDLIFKMNSIFHHKSSNGEPDLEITGLTSDRFVGEIVELNARLIHLLIIRKQNK